MTSYILQVHSRYLDLPLVPPSTGIARHTGYDLVTLNDTWIPKWREMAFKYGVIEFNTSIKPFCFYKLFNE